MTKPSAPKNLDLEEMSLRDFLDSPRSSPQSSPSSSPMNLDSDSESPPNSPKSFAATAEPKRPLKSALKKDPRSSKQIEREQILQEQYTQFAAAATSLNKRIEDMQAFNGEVRAEDNEAVLTLAKQMASIKAALAELDEAKQEPISRKSVSISLQSEKKLVENLDVKALNIEGKSYPRAPGSMLEPEIHREYEIIEDPQQFKVVRYAAIKRLAQVEQKIVGIDAASADIARENTELQNSSSTKSNPIGTAITTLNKRDRVRKANKIFASNHSGLKEKDDYTPTTSRSASSISPSSTPVSTNIDSRGDQPKKPQYGHLR